MGKPRVVAETGRGIERQKKERACEGKNLVRKGRMLWFSHKCFYKYTKAILEDNFMFGKNPNNITLRIIFQTWILLLEFFNLLLL